MKILVVEDEIDLQESIKAFFIEDGNTVKTASTLFIAEDILIDDQFDIIILDVGLPDGSGLDLIKVIGKNQLEASTIILSANNSTEDKIKGLDLGADDYLAKPFHIAELNSRVKAIARRKGKENKSVIIFNEFEINSLNHTASIHGKDLNLTQKELQLLVFFISNQNRVLTKEAISNHLWDGQADLMGNFDLIYTHIKNLRKKIESLGGTNYLKSVYGLGYKFTGQ